ncbi:MAG: polysaccharide deacetylase family protein [Bacteroidota bacterium]
MLRVALSHDVDRTKKHYQYLTYLIKAVLSGNVKNALYHFSSFFGKEPYWNFPGIIRVEQELGVKSTFFFLDETIPFKLFNKKNWQLSLGRYNINQNKIKEIIRWLDQNGWEIGVHGSYHSYNNEKLLKKEKENIENIVGHNIVGTRQHYLNWDENTWQIHKNLGFKYDSTWGLTDGIGIKDDKIVPFKPHSDSFLEIPLMIMDTQFMETEDRWQKFEDIVSQIEQNDGILVLNWHQRVFNEKEFPGFQKAYVRIIEYCKTRNARFATLKEFYEELI